MVKYRNLALVIVFSIITLVIYAVYWLVSTTSELRKMRSSARIQRAVVTILSIFKSMAKGGCNIDFA